MPDNTEPPSEEAFILGPRGGKGKTAKSKKTAKKAPAKKKAAAKKPAKKKKKK